MTIAIALLGAVLAMPTAPSPSLCVPTLATLCQLDWPVDIAVSGHYALVADFSAGLLVIDVSIPSAPLQVASLFAPGARQLNLLGDLAYLSLTDAVVIIDITDPHAPIEIGRFNTGGRVSNLAVAGDLAFYTAGPGAQGRMLQIVDVSNPARPRRLGTSTLALAGTPDSLVADGDRLYAVNHEDGLWILDFSNPAAPFEIGRLELPCAVGVNLSGQLALVACDRDGLKMVDVSDPAHPSVLSTYRDPDPTWGGYSAIAVDGNLVLA